MRAPLVCRPAVHLAWGLALLLLASPSAVAPPTNPAGVAFLEANLANSKDGGVRTMEVAASDGTPIALQYVVAKAGKGKHHPLGNSPIHYHFEGRSVQQYPDGPTFTSSYERKQKIKSTPGNEQAWLGAVLKSMVRPPPRSPLSPCVKEGVVRAGERGEGLGPN
eukprot:SAG22_NODE_359_length_11758_cov_4.094254_19_plen_164_part_00